MEQLQLKELVLWITWIKTKLEKIIKYISLKFEQISCYILLGMKWFKYEINKVFNLLYLKQCRKNLYFCHLIILMNIFYYFDTFKCLLIVWEKVFLTYTCRKVLSHISLVSEPRPSPSWTTSCPLCWVFSYQCNSPMYYLFLLLLIWNNMELMFAFCE